MALNTKVVEKLNHQINRELWSAYFYITFADYYEARGLKGFANWYMIQVQEELAHAKILRRYLHDNGAEVKMGALEAPTKVFENDLEPLKEGLKHEQYVTSLINDCYASAKEVHDYRTMHMLDWFIEEQGEEEANAAEMISNMELFGTTPQGLFALDREYQTRTFTAPTLAM